MGDVMGERTSRCIACGRAILWRRTLSGARTPIDLDGETHWATCPRRELFARRREQLRNVRSGLQLELPEPEEATS